MKDGPLKFCEISFDGAYISLVFHIFAKTSNGAGMTDIIVLMGRSEYFSFAIFYLRQKCW
jgi:hypothetical protein